MDREMLDEILSLDRYKIAAIINNLLVNDEERSIRRWRLCTVPVMYVKIDSNIELKNEKRKKGNENAKHRAKCFQFKIFGKV